MSVFFKKSTPEDLVAWKAQQRAEADADATARTADALRRATAPEGERMTIREWSSTNGRWGVLITAHPRHAGMLARVRANKREDMESMLCVPGRATLRPNKIQGRDVVRVDPSETTFVYADNVEVGNPLRGARIVYSVGLQSGRDAAVLESPEGGCWQEFGYKRRSRWWMTIKDGNAVSMSNDEILSLLGEDHAS